MKNNNFTSNPSALKKHIIYTGGRLFGVREHYVPMFPVLVSGSDGAM
jgi:hypothetical protein